MSYRWLPVGVLVMQNAALIIATKYCSMLSDMDMSYISLTTVLYTEILKFAISLGCCYWFDANRNMMELNTLLTKTFSRDNVELYKLVIPSLLYIIQNNLQYLIESTALFNVLYQLKIVTTAVFFSCMVNSASSTIDSKHRLGKKEWLCIFLLCIGVTMVQISHSDFHEFQISLTVGLLCVGFAILISGYAGVHLEKTIRSSKSSIWLINVQLSVISFTLSCVFFFLVRDNGSNSYLHNFYEYQLHPYVNDTIDLGVTPAALSTSTFAPFFDYSLTGPWNSSVPAAKAFSVTSLLSLNADEDAVPLSTEEKLVDFKLTLPPKSHVGESNTPSSSVGTTPVESYNNDEMELGGRHRKKILKDMHTHHGPGQGEQLRIKKDGTSGVTDVGNRVRMKKPGAGQGTGTRREEVMHNPRGGRGGDGLGSPRERPLAADSPTGSEPGGVTARRSLRSFHPKHINKHHEYTFLPAIPIHNTEDYFIYVVIFLQALSGIVRSMHCCVLLSALFVTFAYVMFSLNVYCS